MLQPKIEPRSIAWKATILTFTPPPLYTVLKNWVIVANGDREGLHFLPNQHLPTNGMGRGLTAKKLPKLISDPFPTKLKTEYLMSKG